METTGPSATKVGVLDHGHVEYVTHCGSDVTVVNAARVSFNKSVDELEDRDRNLIRYLAEHNHWTPFAHPQITLRIKAPIAIRTQLFKHKVGFVENEVSRRYVKDEPEVYIPKWRGAPTDGAKQGSSDFLDKIFVNYEYSVNEALYAYNRLIEKGAAPEQARMVLPQGTYTEWFWTGSLAAYARVVGLRASPDAQWEVRQYAEAIGQIIEPLFPESWAALTNWRVEIDD